MGSILCCNSAGCNLVNPYLLLHLVSPNLYFVLTASQALLSGRAVTRGRSCPRRKRDYNIVQWFQSLDRVV